MAGSTVLDAGCGEGYLARLLAGQGGIVTAVDIAPRLVGLAQAQAQQPALTYLVHDLSKPLPQYTNAFDVVVSNLVLNDVYDYIGYITTLGQVTKPRGRLVLAMNNPYSAVMREKVANYFESGTSVLYQGLSAAGIDVYYFHRTLEAYITAFYKAEFLLQQLSDLPITAEMLKQGAPAKYYQFPYFMILAFVKADAHG